MRFQLVTKLITNTPCVLKVTVVAITFLSFAVAPTSCLADTTYVFSGNITPYYFLPSGAAQSFSYTAPDFIAQDTFVPASSLSECSTGYNATCGGIGFLPSSPGFGIPGQVVQIAFMDGVVNPYYYFPLAAFTVDGTYSAVVFPGANTGTLTVTSTATTPEPGTILLLAGSLVLLFFALGNRSKRRPRAEAAF